MEKDGLSITAIKALADNYIWALEREGNVLIVDPGEATPVLAHLAAGQRKLTAILITHKCTDHVGGVAGLLTTHPGTEVIAPATEGNEHATITVGNGDQVTPQGWPTTFAVHGTPGHTAGHVSYSGDGVLLCGDTLFSCGCGRLFEGDAADLARSMATLAALPDDLLVCCGHEYTLANIKFARAVEPGNASLETWEATATGLVADHLPTLPVTLGQEKENNPFLRADVPAVRAAAAAQAGKELHGAATVLGVLRTWKDGF